MTARRPSASPAYLTIAEVCEVLRIRRATLMRLIADGEIQASTVGRGSGTSTRYRIPATEPARYMEANRADGAARRAS